MQRILVLISLLFAAAHGQRGIRGMQQESSKSDDETFTISAIVTTSSEPKTKTNTHIAKEASTDGTAQLPKRYTVKYKTPAARDKIVTLAEGMIKDKPDDGVMLVQLSDESIAHLSTTNENLHIEEDYPVFELGYQDTPSEQEHRRRRRMAETTPYGISLIQADQVAVGPYVAKVCLVDTGVAPAHEDLTYTDIGGADRYSNVDDEYLAYNGDTRGHGTHIAGTIAARSNNTLGVRGVGAIPLYVTRGLNSLGQAYESDIIEALSQCRNDENVRVISLSLGGSSISSSMSNVYTQLAADGYLLFGASGNSGLNAATYPASHPDVISVTAVKADETYWSYSNYGEWLELAAPGHEIYSTISPSGYAYYSGTSMATPHAAGAAGLLLSHHPGCTAPQIRYILAASAKDLGSSGCDEDYGYGLVQVKDALKLLNQYPCDDANYWSNLPNSTGVCTTL